MAAVEAKSTNVEDETLLSADISSESVVILFIVNFRKCYW